MITRFAPAPTGFLHLGHVLNAIVVWRMARDAGGQVLLRIEDHDRIRSRPEYDAALIEDLGWLGFDADEISRQSERDHVYQQALAHLQSQGLIYACECTRREIAGERYPGTCRDKGLPLSDGLGLRVRIDPGAEHFDDLRLGPQTQWPAEQSGDVLLRDRHGLWTYQMAATADDVAQAITHVIRGEDLLSSTGRQIRLARLLGRPMPPRFLHHALIMKTPAQKLSKSDGDTGVRDLRAKGWSRADVIAEAARLGGLA